MLFVSSVQMATTAVKLTLQIFYLADSTHVAGWTITSMLRKYELFLLIVCETQSESSRIPYWYPCDITAVKKSVAYFFPVHVVIGLTLTCID